MEKPTFIVRTDRYHCKENRPISRQGSCFFQNIFRICEQCIEPGGQQFETLLHNKVIQTAGKRLPAQAALCRKYPLTTAVLSLQITDALCCNHFTSGS